MVAFTDKNVWYSSGEELIVLLEITEYEEGIEERECACGEVQEKNYDKLAHTESDWVIDVEPTCEEKGSKHTYCTVCDTILQIEDISATGHTEAVDKAVSATCTTTGLTEGKHCSVCEKILVPQQEIAKLAHIESAWVVDVDPTCEEKGYTYEEIEEDEAHCE